MIFKPQLLSSHATCLHTRLNEFFLNPIGCSVLPFISQGKQCIMYVLEGECLCLREICINVNKLFIIIFVFCLRCTCIVVIVCLLLVAIFLFVRRSCKQAHYFYLRTYVIGHSFGIIDPVSHTTYVVCVNLYT